jgi:AcrR family transcriptional regulator
VVSERSLHYAEAVPTTKTHRAKPLSVEDRREAIVDVVVPLLLEFGSEVTTRQIAVRAGVAEGTLFRAFGDKDSIIRAAVERFMDPLPLRAMLRSIDTDLPLEQKVHDIVFHLRARFEGVIGIMAASGMTGRPPGLDVRSGFAELLADVLADEIPRLRIDVTHATHFIRLVAFASSIGHLNREAPFTTDELTDLILHGIAANREKDA